MQVQCILGLHLTCTRQESTWLSCRYNTYQGYTQHVQDKKTSGYHAHIRVTLSMYKTRKHLVIMHVQYILGLHLACTRQEVTWLSCRYNAYQGYTQHVQDKKTSGYHARIVVDTLPISLKYRANYPDILAYFHHSCPAPIYFVYGSVSIYRTFTRFIEQLMSCMTGCFHTTVDELLIVSTTLTLSQFLHISVLSYLYIVFFNS